MLRILEHLGRKFIFCTGSCIAIVIGSKVAPADTFNAASVAIVAIVGIFCGSNTLAGIKGLPGKSATDNRDGQP